MKLIKAALCGGLLFAGIIASAQQDPNRTFYRYNMNLLNPAYAGSDSKQMDSYNDKAFDANTELGVNFRSQWSGVDGAPETQTAFFSTALGKKIGFGVAIINDKTFIEQQTDLAVNISYRLKVTDNTNLFFGIRAGATSYDANTEGLNTFGISQDPSLMNIEGSFNPAIGAGVQLKGEKFFLAFSIPNITTTERLEQNDGLAKLGDSKTHMYFASGYDFTINNKLVFKPSVMLRHVEASPLSLDFTAALSLNDKFEFGASYRLNEGIGGLMLLNISESLALGYAYETPFDTPVQEASNGTHEIFMKFKM